MPKFTVEYQVSDPTRSGSGVKGTKQIEAKNASEAKQIFAEKHKASAREKVTRNLSSTQLGSQNPRVTVKDVYSTNKGKDPKKMTKTQRMAADSLKDPKFQAQLKAIKPRSTGGGGGGAQIAMDEYRKTTRKKPF